MRNNVFRRKGLNSKGDAAAGRVEEGGRGIRGVPIPGQESIPKQEFWLYSLCFNQAAGGVSSFDSPALNINKKLAYSPFLCKRAIRRWKDVGK